MAIIFLTGKPGGGKGLLSMRTLERELQETQRPIITNLPIELLPWVNGKGIPQLGLYAYLDFKHGKRFGAEWRVRRVSDEQIAEFFAWRVVGTGKRARLIRVHTDLKRKKDGTEGSIAEFSTKAHALGGHLYLIDEAWKFWGSREWKETGAGVLFYTAQHRHFGDDVFFVTQQTAQMETALHRVAQEYWVVRNRSMLRVGMFRQPDDFRCSVFDSQSSRQPMQQFSFKLDRKGLAQAYDTSAGVGLSGRMAADVGKAHKGVSFKWLVVACCLIPLGAYGFLRGGLVAAKHKLSTVISPGIGQTNSLQHRAADALVSGGKAFAGISLSPAPVATASSLVSPAAEIEGVVCVGQYSLQGVQYFLLSDGSTVNSQMAGRVSEVSRYGFKLDGVRVRMGRGRDKGSDLAPGRGYHPEIKVPSRSMLPTDRNNHPVRVSPL